MCGVEACSQFRSCNLFHVKVYCRPGDSRTQVKEDPGGFALPVLMAQARKLYQVAVCCAVLPRPDHLAGVWANARGQCVSLVLGKRWGK